MAETEKTSNYGLYAAQEIVNQAGLLLEAAAKPENAAARAKLEAEDYTQQEEDRGKALHEQASAAVAGAKGGSGAQTAASQAQLTAKIELVDEFGRRLKKTRAKLQEKDEQIALLGTLNKAIRRTGHSQASLLSRVEAYLAVIAQPITLPGATDPTTIIQAAHITEAQANLLRTRLAAFQSSMSDQDSSEGRAQTLTDDKEQSVHLLDRWLAKWQHIAKADFTEAELTAFAIPANIAKSRRRRPKKDDKPTVDTPTV
jgi:hypothetical protein